VEWIFDMNTPKDDPEKHDRSPSDSNLQKMAEAEFLAASARMTAERSRQFRRYKIIVVIFSIIVILVSIWMIHYALSRILKTPHP